MRPGGSPPRTGPHRFDPDAWPHRWEDGVPAVWPGARFARVWIPVVVSLFAQVPFAVVRALRPDVFDTARPIAFLGLAIAVIGPIGLIAARRFPGPVVSVVTAAASADLLLREPAFGPPYVALAFAIVGAVARGARVWAWVSLGVGWAVTVVGGIALDTPWRPLAVAGITFGILVALGIGEAIRSRRERFEQATRSARSGRQTAVEAERVRIARELHDVLAHSLSQINVQAGVGLHLMATQPEKAAEALANIKESSKSALDEVRSVLGVLRSMTARIRLPHSCRSRTSPASRHSSTPSDHPPSLSHSTSIRLSTRQRRCSSRSTGSHRRHSPTSSGTPMPDRHTCQSTERRARRP